MRCAFHFSALRGCVLCPTGRKEQLSRCSARLPARRYAAHCATPSQALDSDPQLVNEGAMTDGWFIKINVRADLS